MTNWLFLRFDFTVDNLSLYDQRLPEVRCGVFDGGATSVDSITYGTIASPGAANGPVSRNVPTDDCDWSGDSVVPGESSLPVFTIYCAAYVRWCEKYFRASNLPLSRAFLIWRIECPSSINLLIARPSGCERPSERYPTSLSSTIDTRR